jgi:hypothetical protein
MRVVYFQRKSILPQKVAKGLDNENSKISNGNPSKELSTIDIHLYFPYIQYI